MPCALTCLPTEIILRIYNETRSYKPSNEGIVRMSETCSRLRAIALPLIFRKVFNWKKGRYTGGAWPSTAWPYIRVVSVYDQPDSSRNLFYNADLLSTLPSLANVDHILLDVFYDEPDLHDILTSPFLSSINTLRHLDTLSLRQPRFDGPSLMHAIAQMHHLTSLTLALSSHVIQRLKLQEYDRYEELNNVAEILRSVAPVLMRLEISGDLVDLQMIEWTEWPRLSGLRFVGHVPYSYFRPIATVVSRMPILQSLTCDFKAEEKPRPSFIYCPPDYHLHFPLSTILPNLISFSLSNLQPGDQTVRQLPLSLESLRVVALRDTHYLTIGDLNMEPRYHYSALSDGDADLWINAASELPHLSKLTLHLKSIPSPELLHRIAQACPRLQYLELEQASFEFNDNESSDSTLELLVTPLASLLQLRELRLSVELGPALVCERAIGRRIQSLAFKARVNIAAMLFATRLQNLEFLGFSALNQDLITYDRNSIWYMLRIVRKEAGLSVQVIDPI